MGLQAKIDQICDQIDVAKEHPEAQTDQIQALLAESQRAILAVRGTLSRKQVRELGNYVKSQNQNTVDLESRLRTIGKSFFIRNFELYVVHQRDRGNQPLINALLESNPNEGSGVTSRASQGRQIFSLGLVDEALQNIKDSSRVPEEYREKASAILRERENDSRRAQ